MKTIRWGIIGCGDVTEVKSGPALQQAEGSALVAVMRRDGAKAADYAKRHGVPRWYDDAEKLIADPEVDAVYVATPPDSHEPYAIRAAQAGKPVYVEKPMARDHAECVRMIEACRAAHVPLFVAYYRRALPRFLKIKQLVDDGALGAIRCVTIRLYAAPQKEDFDPQKLPWRVKPEIAGGGRFLDLASHTLDVLDYILGPVAAVRGEAGNQAELYPAEDAVAAQLTYESGAFGTGQWIFATWHPRWIDEVQIVGSEGQLTFPTFGEQPIVLENREGRAEFDIRNPKHIQQPLIQTIVDELCGKGRCPSTGESAARTSWVMDECLRAWRGKMNC